MKKCVITVVGKDTVGMISRYMWQNAMNRCQCYVFRKKQRGNQKWKHQQIRQLSQ